MSKTTADVQPGAIYQQAKLTPCQSEEAVLTSTGPGGSAVAAVTFKGSSVHMRIIPGPPRQTDEEAKTD